jgi:hypothetical protein
MGLSSCPHQANAFLGWVKSCEHRWVIFGERLSTGRSAMVGSISLRCGGRRTGLMLVTTSFTMSKPINRD